MNLLPQLGNSSHSVVTLMYLRWEQYLHGPMGSVTHEAPRGGCWRQSPVQDSYWTELSWSLVCCYQECLWMNFPLLWDSHIPVTSHFSLKRFCNWGGIWSLVSSQSLLSVVPNGIQKARQAGSGCQVRDIHGMYGVMDGVSRELSEEPPASFLGGWIGGRVDVLGEWMVTKSASHSWSQFPSLQTMNIKNPLHIQKIPVRIKWNHGEIKFSTPCSVIYMSILFYVFVVVDVYQFGYLGDEIKGRKTWSKWWWKC